MSIVDIAVSGRFEGISQPTGTHRSAALLLAAVKLKTYLSLEVVHPGTQCCFNRLLKQPFWVHLWEQTVFPLASRCKIIWTLMGTGPCLITTKRHVMVVHDLNFKIIPKSFGKAFRTLYHFACGVAAQRAGVVVCFTNYVSAVLQKRLGIPVDRIRVIPQGPGLTGLEKPFDSPMGQNPKKPYFICVGSLQPHKNLAGILAAWEIFRQRHSSFSLKVVGRAQRNFAALDLDLTRLPPDVEFTGYISDEALINLYRGATGFIYPSIEEGFGLPVIESFYCGCPVITSNRSCLPEVSADAGLLVNPYDAVAIAEAMSVLTANETKRNELRAKGFKRASFFTWENAGRKMSNILEKACS